MGRALGRRQPSARSFTLRRMLVGARLVCSDGDCAVLYEAIGWLTELESLGCECGCGLQVLGWPEALGGGFRRDAGPMLMALD